MSVRELYGGKSEFVLELQDLVGVVVRVSQHAMDSFSTGARRKSRMQ